MWSDKAFLFLTKPSDPKYEEEVSGCTASVGLISKTTIYVVSKPPAALPLVLIQFYRQMLVIQDQFSA